MNQPEPPNTKQGAFMRACDPLLGARIVAIKPHTISYDWPAEAATIVVVTEQGQRFALIADNDVDGRAYITWGALDEPT